MPSISGAVLLKRATCDKPWERGWEMISEGTPILLPMPRGGQQEPCGQQRAFPLAARADATPRLRSKTFFRFVFPSVGFFLSAASSEQLCLLCWRGTVKWKKILCELGSVKSTYLLLASAPPSQGAASRYCHGPSRATGFCCRNKSGGFRAPDSKEQWGQPKKNIINSVYALLLKGLTEGCLFCN